MFFLMPLYAARNHFSDLIDVNEGNFSRKRCAKSFEKLEFLHNSQNQSHGMKLLEFV